MAIDTASKRASVQAYALGLMRPVPDGTVNDSDRATAAWLYAGFDYASNDSGGPSPVGVTRAPSILSVGSLINR